MAGAGIREDMRIKSAHSTRLTHNAAFGVLEIYFAPPLPHGNTNSDKWRSSVSTAGPSDTPRQQPHARDASPAASEVACVFECHGTTLDALLISMVEFLTTISAVEFEGARMQYRATHDVNGDASSTTVLSNSGVKYMRRWSADNCRSVNAFQQL